ncbi:MAG: AGE family epimerase/isomerase [Prolixibacteraceae bacterium]|nr:AGE family epimerase/isomerase [Burkholderiales bacterium]
MVSAFASKLHPDVLATEFLDEHARSVLSFYFPACLDSQSGGYHQYFGPDGEPDRENKQRHLVSSSRLTINFATAARHYGDEGFLAAARHGVAFLREGHLNRRTGGYAWIVDNSAVVDGDNQSYGIAFVLMAYARAFEAGVTEAYDHIGETYDFLERHFWEEKHSLYADTLSPDLTRLSPYRGQNANMHCCEAMIAAFEATGERKYLDRATRIASQLTVALTADTDGRIWEHYDENWLHDFAYNKGDATNKLRPWGYQPGHFTEWAKLLLTINRHVPQAWLVSRARELFDHAIRIGYDSRHGGLYYSIAPDGTICGDGKYSWVQAETIAAAAFLADSLNHGLYWCIYRQLWSYVLENMVDHQLKCWHRNLTRENVTHTDAVAMGRTDYHSICACIDISNMLAHRSLL